MAKMEMNTEPTKADRRFSRGLMKAAAAVGAGTLAVSLAACGSTNKGEATGGVAPTVATGSTVPGETSTAATSSPMHFTKTYTEIVQTPGGARTFNGFNTAGGEGARIPHGSWVQVGCIAHDPNNTMGSVAEGDYYVIAVPPVSGTAKISPSNSYDNTTDPNVLAKPLDQQPIYDPAVPFCTAEQMAALNLAQ